MGAPFQQVTGGYGVIRALCNVGSAIILSASMAMGDPVTIAALGDSLTQGYGLPPEDGFVPQLQRWLDDAGADVTLINAGVSGDTTAGGLSRIAWTLSDDVDALILALGGNDLLRGIDPSVSRANLDAILTETTGRDIPVLLIGMDAPPNFGADFEAEFDGMFGELARQHDALLHANFLGALAAMDDRAKVLLTYMQPDGIHPNAMGVQLIVEDIGPSVLRLVSQVD